MQARLHSVLVALWAFTLPAQAVPRAYDLVLEDSKVAFFYAFSERRMKGSFDVLSADTVIDLQDVRRSSLDVVVSTASAMAGDPFSTLAVRGADFLATRKYPTARFVGRSVLPGPDGARIAGDLTLRGITRPVSLNVTFMRRADAPTDNSELILEVSGEVSRFAFGVSGFPSMVEDKIELRFTVHLLRR